MRRSGFPNFLRFQDFAESTRDGEVWRYYDSPPVGGGPGGTGVVYMGHLSGGAAPGTTVGGYKFGGPAPAPAAQPNEAAK